MILLDVKCDQIIDLLDVKVNSRMVQNGLSGNHYQGINHRNVESNVTIFLSIESTDWVRGWMNDIISCLTSIRRPTLDYKRDIFITNKVDMKFTNSYPKNWTLHEDKIELEFTCDYHEIGGNFPELKQIYRDKKIDQILN
jgi:hypothetical protein